MDDINDFIDHKKGNDNTSVWFYFLIYKNGTQAKCKDCPQTLRCVGGSTSGLHTHLRTIHNKNM